MCRLRKEGKAAISAAHKTGTARPRVFEMDPVRAFAPRAPRFNGVMEFMGMPDYWRDPLHERVAQLAVADRVRRQHAVVCAAAAWRAAVLHALGSLQDVVGVREVLLLLSEADGVHASLAAAAGMLLSPEGVLRFGPVRLGDVLVTRAIAAFASAGPGPALPGVARDSGAAGSGLALALPPPARRGADGGSSVSSAGVQARSISGSPASSHGGFFAGRRRSVLSAAGSDALSGTVTGSPASPSGPVGLHDATALTFDRLGASRSSALEVGALFSVTAVLDGPRCDDRPPGARAHDFDTRRAAARPTSATARSYLGALHGLARGDTTTRVRPPAGEQSPATATVGGDAAEQAALGKALRVVGGRLVVGSARVPRTTQSSGFSDSNGHTTLPPSMASAGRSLGSRGGPGRSSRHGEPAEASSQGDRMTLLQLLRWWLPELQPGCHPQGAAHPHPSRPEPASENGPILDRLSFLHMCRTPSPPTTESTAALLESGRGRVRTMYGFAASASFDTPEERHAALLRLRSQSDGLLAEHAKEVLAAVRDGKLGSLTAAAVMEARCAPMPPVSPGGGVLGRGASAAVDGVGIPGSLDRQGSFQLPSSPAPPRSRSGSGSGSGSEIPVISSPAPSSAPVPFPVFAAIVAAAAVPPPGAVQGLGIGVASSTPRSRGRRALHASLSVSGNAPLSSSPASVLTNGSLGRARLNAPPPSPSSASARRHGRAASFGRAMSASGIGGFPAGGSSPSEPGAPGRMGRHISAPASSIGSARSVASTMPLLAPSPAPRLGSALPAIASYAESESPSTVRSGRGRASSAGGSSCASTPLAGSILAAGCPSPKHWRNPSRPLTVPGAGEAPSVSPGGQVSHIVRQVVSMDDMRPLVEALVDTHACTGDVLAADPRLRSRYITVVLVRLICVLHGQTRCDVTATEVLDSSLATVFRQCVGTKMEQVTTFRPSDALAMSAAFDEIAGDERESITIDDVRVRYDRWLGECRRAGEILHPAPFVVPMAVVERAMQGHTRQLASGVRGTFSFEDWVFFELAQDDGMCDTSIEYWFGLLDRDGDGVLGRHDLMDANSALRQAAAHCADVLGDVGEAGEAEPGGAAPGARRSRAVSQVDGMLMHVNAIVRSRQDVAEELPLHAEAAGRGRWGAAAEDGPGSDAYAAAMTADGDDVAPWAALRTMSLPGSPGSPAGPSACSTAASPTVGFPPSGTRDRSESFSEPMGAAPTPPSRAGRATRPTRRTPSGSTPPLTSLLVQWSRIGPELFSATLCVHSRSVNPKVRAYHWDGFIEGRHLMFLKSKEE